MLYGASSPHTECFITHTAHTVHAITNTKECCITKVAVLFDSHSTASSFDPPTQNTTTAPDSPPHLQEEPGLGFQSVSMAIPVHFASYGPALTFSNITLKSEDSAATAS